MMKKFVVALLLLLLPTRVVRHLVPRSIKIGRGAKVGFSIIICQTVDIGQNVRIGHLNIIKVDRLTLGESVSIGHLNRIAGGLDVQMGANASLTNSNKITSPSFNAAVSRLAMADYARIGVGHVFDLTSDICIGRGTTFAGVGTQVWTHSFYFSQTSLKRCRVDNPVSIGDYCNIGSRSIICPGVRIGNGVSLGAGSCVSKDIKEAGLYVSQPLRVIPGFAPEGVIERCEKSDIVLDDYHVEHNSGQGRDAH